MMSILVSIRVPTCLLERATLGMSDKARPGRAYSPFITLAQRRGAKAPVDSTFGVTWRIEKGQA